MIQSTDRQIASLKQELESKQEKLDERKERILREANEEARKILADAKEYADQTMKMFHKFLPTITAGKYSPSKYLPVTPKS